MADLNATLRFTVTADDTAVAVGSGSLAVLGTPRLLAWCEAATCSALAAALADGATSVGTLVHLEHVAASPVGAQIEVTASVTSIEGRTHRFSVTAADVRSGTVVGRAEITRVVVDAQRFMARL